MAQRGPTRPTARIEEAIGFVGMFGVLFLGVTVFCEVTGRPALGWALTLLVAVVAVIVLDRWRVAVLRRHRDETGEVAGIGAAPAAGPHRGRAALRRAGAGVRVAGTTPATGHAHVGWDELGPGGRRPVRRTPRTAGVTARSGGDVPAGRTADVTRLAADATRVRDATRAADGTRASDGTRAADGTRAVADATRVADG